MALFPHYPTSPSVIVEAAATVLGAATQVDKVGESVRAEVAQAQSAVEGQLKAPLASAIAPVSASTEKIIASARYIGGVLALFSTAVTSFDDGVDDLNRRWDDRPMLPSHGDAQARTLLLQTLKIEHGRLEHELDAAAADVAGKLSRGPNGADIADLESAGVMPSRSLLLDPSLDPPIAVEVNGAYVVLGSDSADHVKVVHNDDGTITIMVGQLDPTTGRPTRATTSSSATATTSCSAAPGTTTCTADETRTGWSAAPARTTSRRQRREDKAVVEDGETPAQTESTTTIELTGSPGDDAIELVQPPWMSDPA